MDYDRFRIHLNEMHKEAIDVLNGISQFYKSMVLDYFSRFCRGKEHYWSIKKLFCHAMYIPMFLIIGRKYFERLIYIDTHAGLGLAKVGEAENEIILGSPLIALRWPSIIAEKIRHYSRINDGFDELYFIEKNKNIARILDYIVRKISTNNKAGVYPSDCNEFLPSITTKIFGNSGSADKKRCLLYVFIDPFGELDNQITYEALRTLTENAWVDVMMAVMAPNIARGLSPLSAEEKAEYAEKLFSKTALDKIPSLKRNGSVSYDDVKNAYEIMMKSLGYRRVEFIPVEFEKGILYYMMLAVKGSGEWISGYIDYIAKKAPQDYETLKGLFFQVVGKQRSIKDFY